VRLVWFRNDLRCHGHTPLTQALAGGDAVTALHILCPDQWDAHGVAPARRWFVLHSLLELGESLAARGVDLHVLDGGDFDGSVTALENFVAEQGVTEVFCNREYPLNELNRDRAVARRLEAQGVRIHGFDDGVLVPPRALHTGKGTPYTVFTAYKKRWDVWMDDLQPEAVPAPDWPGGQGRFVGRDRVERALETLSVPDSVTALWHPGEDAARGQLKDFVEQHLGDYKARRDFPADSAAGRLPGGAAGAAGRQGPGGRGHLDR
jgi:deoxyribodipyrimidine photo-lyase